MKKILKVMLTLVLVAGTLFTNVTGFIGADTVMTVEATSSKNPRFEGQDGFPKGCIISYCAKHKLTKVTINGKNVSYSDYPWAKAGRKNIWIDLKKGSNRIEVRDNKGYWVVFYLDCPY